MSNTMREYSFADSTLQKALEELAAKFEMDPDDLVYEI